jgi:hypothetical protein
VDVVWAKVKPGDFSVNPPIPPTPPGVWSAAGDIAGETIARCDSETACQYSVGTYQKGITDNAHLITKASSMLGLSKASVVASPPTKGVPVYVRNGPLVNPNGSLVNLADVYRILTVGPNTTQALDEKLADPALSDPSRIDNGRLPFNIMAGGTGVPVVPAAALISDYFTLDSPAYTARDNDGNAESGNGSVTGATLSDASKNWIPSMHVGKRVVMGIPVQVRRVTANDATTLTLDSPFDPVVPAGSYVLDPVDDVVYGQININTAPRAVIEALLGAIPGATTAKVQGIADEIIQYRDNAAHYGTANISAIFGVNNGVLHPTPGFLTSAEVAFPLAGRGNAEGVLLLPAAVNNQAFGALKLSDTSTTEDGLAVGGAAAREDLTKYMAHYAWLSNLLTVRSDVYIAYIRVDVRDPNNLGANPLATRRYVALIDRSNVRLHRETGTATGGGALGTNQVQVSGGVSGATTWTQNCWSGATLEIIAGTGKGQIRHVVSNTNPTDVPPYTLTLDRNWDIGLDTTSTYRLYFRPNVLMFSAVN